ncbi:MAG: response regulator [Anaerolineae bacterium]|nr:response regulator [Anaerolineae bacterium]
MAEKQKEILIVEDDAELCELLAQAVQDLSNTYAVKTAGNVDEAMVQVRRFQTLKKAFDLVITDIKMAGLSGLELLEVLNSIAPETKTIVMTAYNSAELAERAQELNVYAYLTKPFVISEFRQIVQGVVAPQKQTTATESSGAKPKLSNAQTRAVRQQLASLRLMTGANATFLLDKTGTLLVLDALEANMSLGGLSEALIIAQRHIEQQINASLAKQARVNQSYFGTDSFNICTCRIPNDRFIGTLFGPAVREGQVWYYMRDAVPQIQEALKATESGETLAESKRSLKDEYIAMVDQYFAGSNRRRRRRRGQEMVEQAEPELPVEPGPQNVSPESPPARIPVVEALPPDPLAQVEVQEADLEAIQDIDWNLDADMDWNDLVSETDQGFKGITLEEAQQQGVDLGQIVSTEGADSTPVAIDEEEEEATLDEIDWNLGANMDWNTLVSATDKGFEGISIDEAKKQGLIDDL